MRSIVAKNKSRAWLTGLFACLLALALSVSLTACGGSDNAASEQAGESAASSQPAVSADEAASTDEAASADEAAADTDTTEADEAAADALRIVSMKGPTSIGMASMMADDLGEFTVVAGADEAAALLTQGEVDVACVPANLAATLYQKTDGKIRVLAVNTLGVLYAVTADTAVGSMADLAGKTVYMTGKGTVPEYTVLALLEANGLSTADVDLQFKSEPAEVAALLEAEPEAVGILPQPYATAATLQSDTLRQAIDLTAAWQEAIAQGDAGVAGQIVTGVTVCLAPTLEEQAGALSVFLDRFATSAALAESDPAAIAPEVVELGIVGNEAVATQAIPLCNVVCLTGEAMQDALSGYLDTLYAQNPESIGGDMPGEDFYWLGA